MNKMIKLTAATVASLLIAASAFSQDAVEKPQTEKNQEIIIRKNDGKTEKMTIIVDGDNVTINGKPVDEFKNSGVTVLRRSRPAIAAVPPVPGARSFRRSGPSFNFENFDHLMPAEANKALLGVMTQKDENGAKISNVTKESGAEKAGLKKNDIITKVGSTTIAEPADLNKAISEYKPNDKVDITYKRDGKENKTTVTLTENKAGVYAFNLNGNDFNFDFPRGEFGPQGSFTFNRRPKIGLQIQDLEEGKGVNVKRR